MRLSEIIENDRLIRFIMENNVFNEKTRTSDPKRAQQRVDFLLSLHQQLTILELEWRDKDNKVYLAEQKKKAAKKESLSKVGAKLNRRTDGLVVASTERA